jgi:hypothetical protein
MPEEWRRRVQRQCEATREPVYRGATSRRPWV